MSLTFEEIESVTNDWFMLEDGKAVDIYFETSFLLNYLLKQQKGLWKRPSGGEKIRVPLEYDGQESGFYSKGDTLSSDDRESINAAYFDWKHAYGNATIYRIDTLKNSGPEGLVDIVTQRISGAQKTLTKTLADSIFDDAGASSERLTGLLACCNETSTLAYGGIAEDDLVADDGTKPWEGKRDTTTESLSFNVLSSMRRDAHLKNGPNGAPDLIVMTRELYDVTVSIARASQRFTNSEKTAKVGFTGMEFEGAAIFPDDFCPSGYAIAINTNHLGFAVHKNGYFVRSRWMKIPDSAEDKTMKIYFDGNLICNNRKAMIAHSNLS